MKHLAYCEGHLVAVVQKDRHGKWEIRWPRREWSRERIANPDSAKYWVASLMKGKLVTWLETNKEQV